MDDGYPSRELVKTFDLDFGRVGLQTCYDMNFMDTWRELYAQHTDIVFWPSAYGGGMPMRGFAKLYHFNVVPAGWGDITDTTGQVAKGQSQEAPGIFTATLDLDKTWFHQNFNSNITKLLADHKGDVIVESLPGYCSTDGNCSAIGDLSAESQFFLLARTDAGYAKGLSVRALKDEYGLTDLLTYQHQARRAINMQRMTASPNVKPWAYNTNGSSTPPSPDNPSSGATDPRKDEFSTLMSGVDGYTSSTEPELSALISGGSAFLKAEGSRGWRGVPDDTGTVDM
jgi:hypothetical protein